MTRHNELKLENVMKVVESLEVRGSYDEVRRAEAVKALKEILVDEKEMSFAAR